MFCQARGSEVNERIPHLRPKMMSREEVIVGHHLLNDLPVSAVISLLEWLLPKSLEPFEVFEMMTADISETPLNFRKAAESVVYVEAEGLKILLLASCDLLEEKILGGAARGDRPQELPHPGSELGEV